MNKQDPFEDLILRDSALSEEEKTSLESHLLTCVRCCQLQAGWATARKEIQTAPEHHPAAGFSHRWAASLPERRFKAQQQQVKKFLRYLIGITLISFIGLVITVLIGTSPLELLSGALHTGMVVFLYGKHIQNLLLVTMHSVPLILPVTLWILITTGFCLTVFVWGGTMYRYVIKGAPAK
jgi:hypothetical protein